MKLSLTFGLTVNNFWRRIVNTSMIIVMISALIASRSLYAQCLQPPTGMVAWWPGDNNANDIFNGNNGTLMSGATYTAAGKVLQAFDFNNGGGYVAVPSSSTLNFGTGDFSIDAWVKRDPLGSNSPPSVLVDKRAADNIGYSLTVSYGRLVFQMSGTNYFTTTTPVAADGIWHFVAVTVHRASGGGQFYCDGIPLDTFTPLSGNLDNATALRIGAGYNSGNQPWLGSIDEVELFGRVLSSTEVSNIFLAGSFGKCKPCPQGSLPHPRISPSFTPLDTVCMDISTSCLYTCENQYQTFCTLPHSGNTYTWSVLPPATIVAGQGTNCATVLWGTQGTGSISVVETNPSTGCSGEDSRCVKIIDSPEAQFTLPSNVCLNTTVSFDAGPSHGAISFFWIFGDGNTSTNKFTTHTYTTPGTYEVVLVVANKCGCTDSVTHQIVVDQLAGPQIDCIATVCPNSVVNYSTPLCAGATYNWSASGGNILSPTPYTNSISVLWGSGPQGTISLSITGCGNNPCPGTTTRIVPIVPTSAQIEGPTVVCIGDNSTYSLPCWPGTWYTWNLSGGGYIASGQNSCNITVNWYGTGPATLTANWTDILLGCSGTSTLNIVVKPTFSIISGNAGPVCIGSPSTYQANGAANWTATGGQINSGNGTTTVSVTWQSGGQQTITATPTSPSSWCNSSASMMVDVASVPQALSIAGPVSICATEKYTYKATASGPNYTLSWSVAGSGAIQGSSAANPVTVQWNGSGMISVRQVQTVPPYCSSEPISMVVNPVSLSIAGATSACMDGTESYSAGPPNPFVEYTWSIESSPSTTSPAPYGTILSGQGTNAISVLWHGPGATAYVKVKACGVVQQTLTVTVHPKPAASIDVIGKLCNTVTLTASPSGASYVWSTGEITQSINTTIAGTFWVDVTQNGCTSRASVDVPAGIPPVAKISTPDPTNFCPPTSVSATLYALKGPGYSYQWYPAGPTSDNWTVTSVGSYYVVVTGPNGCVRTSNTITITQDPCIPSTCTPVPYTLSFTQALNGAACNDIHFTAVFTGGPATNFSWDFGDGSPLGSGSPVNHVYTEAGYYHVVLSSDVPNANPPPGTCRVSYTGVVSVDRVASFSYIKNCGGSVTFTDQSTYLPPPKAGISTWNWTFTGGTPSSWNSQFPPTVTFPSGSHGVTLVVTSGAGCTSTFTQNVVVDAPPSAAFTLPSSVCVGVEVPISGPASLSSWSWNFGDGATSALQSPAHAWTVGGSYTVTLNGKDANGCPATQGSASVFINTVGTCSITPSNPNPICEGNTTTLTASAGASHEWTRTSFDGPHVAGTINPLSASESGNYTVVVTDANGCKSTSLPVTVIVNPPPPAVISSDVPPVICGSGYITLSAPSEYHYSWTGGPPAPPSGDVSSVTLWLYTPGTYSYAVTVNDNATGCSATSAPFTINVYSLPSVSISYSPSLQLCPGQSTTLTSSQATNILWSTGGTTQSIIVGEDGVYSVTYTDPVSGCAATTSVTVHVQQPPDWCSYPIGCDNLCDTVRIPAPTGPWNGYYTYEWFKNGVYVGTGNPLDLTPMPAGDYTVKLTGPNGCVFTSGVYDLVTHPCDSCDEDSLVINTGWNQKLGTLIPVGQAENEWTVVSDPDPNTTEPRPAYVISEHPAWAQPQLNSRWVSSYPTYSDQLNGHYKFEFKFCLNDTIGASLCLHIRADDTASVFLNGHFIGSTGLLTFLPSRQPKDLCTSQYFVSGQNRLLVDVHNTNQVAMGFDIVGTIHGHVPQYWCCCSDSTAGLVGIKWNDLDGDGIRDPGEPTLWNWPINLMKDGVTLKATRTDSLGHYYFMNLPPDQTYTVMEGGEQGWTGTYPVLGTYHVTPASCQVIDTLNFGNKFAACDSCVTPPNNMVAWWYLDEVSGSMVRDAVGHKPPTGGSGINDGTSYPGNIGSGGPTPIAGQYVSNSLQFSNGTYVKVASNNNLEPGSADFTIDAWFKWSSDTGTFLQKMAPDGYGYRLAFPAANTVQLYFRFADGISGTSGPVAITAGQWCHIAATVRRLHPIDADVTLYKNGVRVWNQTYSTSGAISSTSDFFIGGTGQTQAPRVAVDEVEIFNRMLDSTEIRAMYNAGPCGKCKWRLCYASVIDTVSPSWNIVSLSLAGIGDSVIRVFPSAVSRAYAFVPQSGYVPRDTVEIGRGYWLKFPALEYYTFSGCPIECDTISVVAGWNLIGTTSYPVATSSVTSIPPGIVLTNFFGYSSTGYAVATTLLPFKGYWVKVSQAGWVILCSGNPVYEKNASVGANTAEAVSDMELLDASGCRQTLQFAPESDEFRNPDRYELPPLPPSGIFDARFSTSRFLETVKDGEERTIPIQVSSAHYPLTITWEMRDRAVTATLIVDNREVLLNTSGSVSVTGPQTSIALRLGAHTSLPKDFALIQNYPNPFNPVTTIKYQLPTQSRVILKVYDLLGREVATLVNGNEEAGYKAVQWDASSVASGVYFYRLDAGPVNGAGRFTSVKKLLLLK